MSSDMRLSDDSNYREYIDRIHTQEYSMARCALEKCLNSATDGATRAFLLQRIGLTYFFEDDRERAREYYRLAEKEDCGSLLPAYESAKFLAERLKAYEEAIAKCEMIIKVAMASPSARTREDLSSDYYFERASELKSLCCKNLGVENR